MGVITDGDGDHIAITINDPGLPADLDEREEVLAELESAIRTVLDRQGVEPTDITVIGGHTYTQLLPQCPVCGEKVLIHRPELNDENGAVASAECDCGWNADAIYKLVELRDPSERISGILQQRLIDGFNTERSPLARYGLEPSYFPF